MKFKASDLLNDEVIYDAVYDEIIDHTRWSVVHAVVFKYEGKYWQTKYSVGATESQDERLWEGQDEVACREVELKEVLVKQWVPVEVKD